MSHLNPNPFDRQTTAPASLVTLNLKTRMAIAVVALVLVTTVLVTSVSLLLAKRGMKAIISEQQFALLGRVADEIDQKFVSRQVTLQSLALNIPQNSYGNGAWLQRYLEQHANLQSLFDNLLVFDARGTLVANLAQPAVRGNIDFASGRYIKDTLSSRHPVISAPLHSAAAQRAIVTMTMPVLNARGEVVLIIAGLIDPEQDNFLGQLARMQIGLTGYIYVVTGDGTTITHPNKLHVLQNATALEGNNSELGRAFAGFEGTVEGLNRLKKNTLQTFKRLKTTNWIVGATYPEEEAFAPIVEVERRAVLAAVLLAIFIGPLAWWITRYQISPLQRLHNRIQALRDNPAQVALPMLYRNDEIGNLAQAFDRLMRERLFAEAKYQSIEAELRAATDSSLDAFFILHAERGDSEQIVDFRFHYLNANAEQLIGLTQFDVQDKRLCELLPVMRSGGWFDKYAGVVSSRQPLQEEFAMQSPDIRAKWLHTQVVPVADGVAITMRDMTERKQQETDLRDNRAFLKSLIDYLPVLVFAKSFRSGQHDKLVVWNKTAETVMGYPADKVLGKSNHEIFPPKVAATLNELDRQMLAAPKVVIIPEFPYRRPDGVLRYLRSISVPLFGDNDRLDYILGIVEDVTERRSQELELRTRQAELMAVNDALPLGLFRTDPQGGYTYVNRTYEAMTGLSFAEAYGNGWRSALHPDERGKAGAGWDDATRNCIPYQDSYRFMHDDGRIVRAAIKTAPILVDGKLTGYVGSVDDVTARFEAQQALSDSEQRLRMITDNLPVLIAYIDKDERYRFCNNYFERVFNAAPGALLGCTVREVIGEQAYADDADKIVKVLGGERVKYERRFSEKAGERHCLIDCIPDRAHDGEVAGFYLMVLEITELKLVEHKLRTLVRRDSLTGLANRHHFNEILDDAIASSEHSGLPMALMFLDIDHFKKINDTVGHHGGDEVLRQFSQRLQSCIRQTDTVARLAGDEFVIILESLYQPGEAANIAQKIIKNMECEFEILGEMRRVSASIGVTIRRAREFDAETLLRRADDALYLAKDAGRNTFKVII